MTQQTLATRAGVAVRTVARIESGEDVRLGTLVRLADALNTTAVDLISAHKQAAAIANHANDGHVVITSDDLGAVVEHHSGAVAS